MFAETETLLKIKFRLFKLKSQRPYLKYLVTNNTSPGVMLRKLGCINKLLWCLSGIFETAFQARTYLVTRIDLQNNLW